MGIFDGLMNIFDPAQVPAAPVAPTGQTMKPPFVQYLDSLGVQMPEVNPEDEKKRAIAHALVSFGSSLSGSNGQNFLPALSGALNSGAGTYLDQRDTTAKTEQQQKLEKLKLALGWDQNRQEMSSKSALAILEQANKDREFNKPTPSIQDFEYAKRKGYSGTFEDWKKLSSRGTDMKPPSGFQWKQGGGMEPAPGGPYDPEAAAEREAVKAERMGTVRGSNEWNRLRQARKDDLHQKWTELHLDDEGFHSMYPDKYDAAMEEYKRIVEAGDQAPVQTPSVGGSTAVPPQQMQHPAPNQGQGPPLATRADPARPASQEEFDALPSGAVYINPSDGKPYRKN